MKLILFSSISIWAALTISACTQSAESLTPLPQSDVATPPEVTTVQITGYTPQAGNTFQNLFVSNDSVVVSSGQLLYSTARDLSDTLKESLTATYGFSINSPESVVTGFADLLLFQAGLNLSQQSLVACSSSLMLSSSNDALIYNDDRVTGSPTTFLGLRDCEKVYTGLDPQKFNFNGNGMPDYLQMRCGMNPLDAEQAFVSTAGDGVADIDKCKRHIPIDENASTQANQLFAYQYNTQLNSDGTTTLTVSNIPILNDGAENFIALYLTETNSTTNTQSLYTAYAVLKAGYGNKTLKFAYWATSSPATHFNQEIVVP